MSQNNIESNEMEEGLKTLVQQWKQQLKLRDMGVTAKATWKKIKEVANLEEQVKILEEQFIGE
jgi:hypothetical protein